MNVFIVSGVLYINQKLIVFERALDTSNKWNLKQHGVNV